MRRACQLLAGPDGSEEAHLHLRVRRVHLSALGPRDGRRPHGGIAASGDEPSLQEAHGVRETLVGGHLPHRPPRNGFVDANHPEREVTVGRHLNARISHARRYPTSRGDHPPPSCDEGGTIPKRPPYRVGSMPFASAISEHPVTAHAVGELAGSVLENLGERPDLAMVFVTPPHAGALEDAVGAIDELLHPLALLGCAAESVVGPHREVERTAAVSLFAGRTGPLIPLVLEAGMGDGEGPEFLSGWPPQIPFEPVALVLVSDPYSFPIEEFLEWMDRRHPGVPVIGGVASAARGPGGNRLAVGRAVRSSGAIGAVLGPGVDVEAVVSQGCRPFGDPLVVTKAERNVIIELAGRPALERLVTQAHNSLSEDDVSLLEMGGLHVGRVIDEHHERFDRGDFLVRNVIGSDRRHGALAVTEVVPVGTTVQFHLRDAKTADEDLRLMLRGKRADGALLFTCNGRGTRMFEEPHHDVGVLAEVLGPLPVAGFFAAGELGPVGGHNFLHGFTASVALLRDLSS